jgi:hypothetical protein
MAVGLKFNHVMPGGKMSTPAGGDAFLHELELTVRAELTLTETSLPAEQVDGIRGDPWPPDPDVQRYEVGLHALLGAVEALEGASDPGCHPSSAEIAEGVMTAGRLPEPGPGISRASAQQSDRAME